MTRPPHIEIKPIYLNYGTSGSTRSPHNWDHNHTSSPTPAPFTMAPSLPQVSVSRIRTYLFRLPLFTRAIIAIIILLWLVGFQSFWDIRKWGALEPKEIGISTRELPLFFSLSSLLFSSLLFSSLLFSSLLFSSLLFSFASLG
jgi:hypothetical protein